MEEKAAREAVAAKMQQKMEENINVDRLERLAEDYFVDEKQIVTYWNAFTTYDGDGSGDIDAAELQKLLKDLGLQLSEEEIEDIIRQVDTIGRGTIPFGDFVELMADPEGPLAQLLASSVSKGVIDPRQAKLKRRHMQVRRTRQEISAKKRIKVAAKLRPCNRSESMQMGSVGAAGINAVAVSDDGLLVAVGDGRGHAVVYRWMPEWLRPKENARDPSEVVGSPLQSFDNLSRRSSMEVESPIGASVGLDGSGSPGSAVSPMIRAQPSSSVPGDGKEDPDLFKEVAVLAHHHRIRCLAWSHTDIGPMVASGTADGRVRLWRQMGEGRLRVQVREADLRRAKFGHEECYVVIRVGQKVHYGKTVMVEKHIVWEHGKGEEMELNCASDSINVVLYVRPKLKERKHSAEEEAAAEIAKSTKGGTFAAITKTKERLLGKGLKPKVLDRVTVATAFVEAGWADPSEGAIGTVVEILYGGLECVVEWDNVDPEVLKAKKRMEREAARKARKQAQQGDDWKSDEATDGEGSEGMARTETGSEEDEERGTQRYEASREEEEEDELEGPKDFPASHEGAMPTGMGEKGKTGTAGGTPVYSLALHSRAMAASSVYALKAAALTDLSEGGKGAWVELTSVDESDSVMDAHAHSPMEKSGSVANLGGSESRADLGNNGGLSDRNKSGSSLHLGKSGSTANLVRSDSMSSGGSFSDHPAARGLKKGSLLRGASSLSLKSMVGQRQPSSAQLQQGSFRQVFPLDRGDSSFSVGGSSDMSEEDAWEMSGEKYSGQIRLQAEWIHYPRTWEWIGGSGDMRHPGEVTGVQFLELEGGEGEEAGEDPGPEVLSCSTQGCCRSWKEAKKWGSGGKMIQELMLQYRDNKDNKKAAAAKKKAAKGSASQGSPLKGVSQGSPIRGARHKGLFDDSGSRKGRGSSIDALGGKLGSQRQSKPGSLRRASMEDSTNKGSFRRSSMEDTTNKGSLRRASMEDSASTRRGSLTANTAKGSFRRASMEDSTYLVRRQSSLAKGDADALLVKLDTNVERSGDGGGQMGALPRRKGSMVYGKDAQDPSGKPGEEEPTLEEKNTSMSNESVERPASRGSTSGSGSRPGSRGSVDVDRRPGSRGSVQSTGSLDGRPGSRGSVPGSFRKQGSGRVGKKAAPKRKPSMEELMTGVDWARGLVLDNDPHVQAHLRSHVSAGALDCVRKLRFGNKLVVGRGLKGMHWSDLESIPGGRGAPGWLRRQRSTLPGSRSPWLILEGNNGAVCVWTRSQLAVANGVAGTVAGQFVSMVAEEGELLDEEEEEEGGEAATQEEEMEEEEEEEESEDDEEEEDTGHDAEEGHEQQKRMEVEDAKTAGWSLDSILRAGQRVSEPATDEGWHRIAVSPVEEAVVAVSDGRILELWKGRTPQPHGARPHGKTASAKWERIAMFVEHRDSIRAIGWREDGRLLASCDVGGTVKLWARAGDHGISRVQKMATGSGGWLCVETVQLTSDEGRPSGAATLCLGTGPCKRYLFVGTEDETVWVLDTEGLAPFHHVPTASMAAGLGIRQI